MFKPLSSQFTSDDFLFNLLHRDGAVALLAKQRTPHSLPSFEVIIIQVHPAQRIFGRDLPEREAMPSSEVWGTFGWSFSGLADAQGRFKQLCRAQRKGHSPFKGLVASASDDSPEPSAATTKLTTAKTP